MNSFPYDEWELSDEDTAYFNRLTEAIIKGKIADYLAKTEANLMNEASLNSQYTQQVNNEVTGTYTLVGEGYQALMKGLPQILKEIPVEEAYKVQQEVDQWNDQLINITSYTSFMTKMISDGQGLQDAFSLSNDSIFVFYQVAREYINDHHYSEALAIFYLLSQLNPQVQEFWLGLAACYFDQGNYTDAVPNYQKAIELKNQDPIPHVFLAAGYIELNNAALAEEHLHHAKEKMGDSQSFDHLKSKAKDLHKKLKTLKKIST